MKIKTLLLYTADLQKQKDFYTEVLNLLLLKETSDSFTVQVGSSALTFQAHAEPPAEKHYYHFAFNIPANQIKEGLAWLKNKGIEIIKDGDNEIIDFKNWNAEAVYFFDPAGNILELIARKKLDNASDQAFGAPSILNISEIGWPVENVRKTFDYVNAKYQMERYSGDLQRFCAAGDEEGLFILVDEAQKLWYPTEIPAKHFPWIVNGEIMS